MTFMENEVVGDLESIRSGIGMPSTVLSIHHVLIYRYLQVGRLLQGRCVSSCIPTVYRYWRRDPVYRESDEGAPVLGLETNSRA